MDRLNRLYRKALKGVKSQEERKRIVETIKEIEEYIEMRKTTPLTEEEEAELQKTISEFEKNIWLGGDGDEAENGNANGGQEDACQSGQYGGQW